MEIGTKRGFLDHSGSATDPTLKSNQSGHGKNPCTVGTKSAQILAARRVNASGGNIGTLSSLHLEDDPKSGASLNALMRPVSEAAHDALA
jgi:hypothetical protein